MVLIKVAPNGSGKCESHRPERPGFQVLHPLTGRASEVNLTLYCPHLVRGKLVLSTMDVLPILPWGLPGLSPHWLSSSPAHVCPVTLPFSALPGGTAPVPRDYSTRKGRGVCVFLCVYTLVLSPHKPARFGRSCCGSADTNLTSIHEDTGSIPSLAQWVKDPMLP